MIFFVVFFSTLCFSCYSFGVKRFAMFEPALNRFEERKKKEKKKTKRSIRITIDFYE